MNDISGTGTPVREPVVTIGCHPDYRHGAACFWLDGKPTRLPVGTIVRCLAAGMSEEEIVGNYGWPTPAMIAAARGYDWPAIRSAEVEIEDLGVACACGEEAASAEAAQRFVDLDWAAGVPYACRICGRRWTVRVTVEAA